MSNIKGMAKDLQGRDGTAIGTDIECILFVMNMDILMKIKDTFEKEFQ